MYNHYKFLVTFFVQIENFGLFYLEKKKESLKLNFFLPYQYFRAGFTLVI
jgi:hypothetical protein